ncbi:MAG: hypothetical protein D6743_04585 [Calditrichaeota bacterium]|nr:MAG: hypothetical protein D6743_04585 [Calditrichota bacterium]
MAIRKAGVSLFAVFVLIFMQSLAYSQDGAEDVQSEIETLKKQVAQLQQAIAQLQSQLSDSTRSTAKSETEKELEAELARELAQGAAPAQQPQQKTQAPAGISQQTLSARRKFFQNMNPNISVIGTILGAASSLDALDRNVDLAFQEGEFSFQAAVDPYAKADVFISFGKEVEAPLVPEPDTSEPMGPSGLEPEIEEAYVTLLSLPFSTQLKAGKFRSRFGKINETHPHAYNFINTPLMYTNFLGADGLNDEGISINWLLPNAAFFQELTFQVTSGPLESSGFARAEDNHLLYLGHLRNLFDLNENTTLELGFTGLVGPNNSEGQTTKIFASDLTVKWKPLRFNRYKSIEWMSEFLVSKHDGVERDVTSIGLYSFLRYQVAKRWFLGAKYDYSEFPEFSDLHHQAFSGIVQFFTTEFQKFELEYRYNQGDFFSDFSDIKMRAVFVIGSHGAHQY